MTTRSSPQQRTPAAQPPQRASSRFPFWFMVSALAIAVLAFGFYVRGGGGPFGGSPSSNDLAARTIHNAPPNAETISDLDELRERFGDPPDATYGTMRIPSIGIEAPIGTRVVGEDGVMADPTGPSDVVWY